MFNMSENPRVKKGITKLKVYLKQCMTAFYRLHSERLSTVVYPGNELLAIGEILRRFFMITDTIFSCSQVNGLVRFSS